MIFFFFKKKKEYEVKYGVVGSEIGIRERICPKKKKKKKESLTGDRGQVTRDMSHLTWYRSSIHTFPFRRALPFNKY